jgi:hypothetical protein
MCNELGVVCADAVKGVASARTHKQGLMFGSAELTHSLPVPKPTATPFQFSVTNRLMLFRDVSDP